VKQNVRYKPKAATSVPKKGVTNVGDSSNLSSKLRNTGTSFNKDNITLPNSFSALNIDEGEEEEEEEEPDLVDVVTIGVPSLTRDDFTRETIRVEYEWRPPRCDVCKIFGHLYYHCPKKEASPLIVSTSNVGSPIVEKTNDGFQTVGKKKKRKEEEEEEVVENVYDETANIFPNTKIDESSSFTAAAG
nr:zinc knuckle CX2CX4HX4C [Tanacetum cinerariifolium]